MANLLVEVMALQQYVTEDLRHLADQRVRIRYSSGVGVIGTVIATLPEEGEPYLLILEDADIIDPNGDLLEQHKLYSAVIGSMLSLERYVPLS